MRRRIPLPEFLRDVLLLSLSAFGGPQAHITVFLQHLVYKKQYLEEDELLQINALCQFLPGPTSTQTLIAIGHKLGGPRLAFLTLLVWVFPATVIMTTLALAYVYFEQQHLPTDFSRYLQPMAVGFIAYSAVRLSRSLVTNLTQAGYLSIALVSVLLIRSSLVYPIVLLLAGWLSTRRTNTSGPVPTWPELRPRWGNLYLLLGLFAASALVGNFFQLKPVLIFENTFRYGSMVFGGGQVLVPLLFEQFVLNKGYLTASEFLTGWGAAQAVPGPVFTFTSFTHALAMKEYGSGGMVLGAFLGMSGIFLPGALLIFFIYPTWEKLKDWSLIQNALKGVNAAACGFIAAAAILLARTLPPTTDNLLAGILAFLGLYLLKLPPVLIVGLCLFVGLVMAI